MMFAPTSPDFHAGSKVVHCKHRVERLLYTFHCDIQYFRPKWVLLVDSVGCLAVVVSDVGKGDGTDLHHPSTIREVNGRVIPLSDLLVVAVPRDVDHGLSVWRDTLQRERATEVGSSNERDALWVGAMQGRGNRIYVCQGERGREGGREGGREEGGGRCIPWQVV